MDLLNNLSDNERLLISKAPAYVCVLIAGADGLIDKAEIKNALKIAKEKSSKTHAFLIQFYQNIENGFASELEEAIASMPEDVDKRNQQLTEKLEGLNPILDKADKTFSITYYAFLKEIAKRIAKASGGVLGISSISKEEKQFIDLPMIKDPSIMFGKSDQ